VKALFLTNEYPPRIYGGAGVHVDYLSRELAKLMEVEVRCFGDQNSLGKNLVVRGFELDTSGFTCRSPCARSSRGATCVDFNTPEITADLVHCHTWYSHFGGILAKAELRNSLVITVHSLEPLRPWKREQTRRRLRFYRLLEKDALEMADAVIAVSKETKADLERLFVIEPSAFARDLQRYRSGWNIDPPIRPKRCARYGIDPAKPFLLFVGRITRQKGIVHLVRAIQFMDPVFRSSCAPALRILRRSPRK